MKKGIAINTLGIMIILLVVMLMLIYIMIQIKGDGSNIISDFFGFLAS
jgi:hypothetical protein